MLGLLLDTQYNIMEQNNINFYLICLTSVSPHTTHQELVEQSHLFVDGELPARARANAMKCRKCENYDERGAQLNLIESY